MTSAKLKELYKEKGKYVILAVITALLFFSNLWEPLWIIASVVLVALYATCSISEMFCFTMYFELFSSWDLFFVVNLLIAFVSLTVRYIIDVKKKQKEVFVLPLVLSFVITIVFGVIHYEVNLDGFSKGGLFVAMLFVFYYVFIYHKEISLDNCFRFLTLGMIVSSVLGVASLLIDSPLRSIIYIDSVGYKRLQLYSFHTNFLALLCLFNVAFYVYKMVNSKGKIWESVICIAISTVLGILTLSKAFLLLFAAIAVYFVVFLIVKYKKHSWKFVVPIVVVAVALVAVFHEFIGNIIQRFLAYDTGSIISKLTTGRTRIWSQYVESARSSVLKMLFGVGLFTKDLIAIGPHNVLLFLLYRIGVVGIILMCVLGYSYFKCSKTKLKITLKNCLPILLWIVISLEEMILSERFTYFLLFAIILLIQEKNQKEQIETNDIKQN